MEHLGPEADLREEILEGVSRAAVLDMLRKLLSVNQGNLLVSRQSGPHDSVRLKLLRHTYATAGHRRRVPVSGRAVRP